MYTIKDNANKEIEKAKRALNKAIEILAATPEYNSAGLIFHNATVQDVNRLITAAQLLND